MYYYIIKRYCISKLNLLKDIILKKAKSIVLFRNKKQTMKQNKNENKEDKNGKNKIFQLEGILQFRK